MRLGHVGPLRRGNLDNPGRRNLPISYVPKRQIVPQRRDTALRPTAHRLLPGRVCEPVAG
jgi:hypothetical protein